MFLLHLGSPIPMDPHSHGQEVLVFSDALQTLIQHSHVCQDERMLSIPCQEGTEVQGEGKKVFRTSPPWKRQWHQQHAPVSERHYSMEEQSVRLLLARWK
ncbi:uncharacterized protein J5F26_003676 isoform 2-T2 [Ciconia maguari]